MRKIYARCISFVLVEGHPVGIAVTEKRYAELTARYEKAKTGYDDIAEQIESEKAKLEIFKGFIWTLEKQKCLGSFQVEKVQVVYYNRIMLGGVLIPPNRNF